MRPYLRRLSALLPTSAQKELARSLTGQVEAAHAGAEIALAMVGKELSPAKARRRIAEVERDGDEMRRRLVEQLARTLAAPLDREDLFRLSRAIDDILDTLRDFIREADLYRIEKRSRYRPFLVNVVAAISSLADAVDALWHGPQTVPLMALATKKAAGAISRDYQDAFAAIVAGPMTPTALKHRELTKRLDSVGARIQEAADVLTDGALKRGY